MDDTSLVDIIDEFLERRHVEDNERDYSHFHPSEFYGCKRQIAYRYYLQKELITIDAKKLVPEPGLLRVFDNGHCVHKRWQNYLKDKRCARAMLKGRWRCSNAYAHELRWKVNGAAKEESEPKIFGKEQTLGTTYPEFKCDCGCPDFKYEEIGFYDEMTWLGGHIDGLLLYSTGEHLLLDYKSINSRGYGRLYGKPKPEHHIQIQCYLYLSGLNYGKVIYENKDNQRDIKEILVERDQATINFMISDAIDLKKILTTVKKNGKRILPLKSNSLNPDKDESSGGREVIRYTEGMSTCVYCPFKTICWK